MAGRFDRAENAPKLEATAGPLMGKSFPLNDELLIGAAYENDVVIHGDPTLSGHHARMRLTDFELTIEDSRSTNGTFVNGVRLGKNRKLLKPDDEIRVGRSVFVVRNG
jgi:pSer/pThr/pTyr-binding forkhead associated (FHA) protein